MTARTELSPAIDSSASRRAIFTGTVSALSASGRSSVSVATAPSMSTRRPSVSGSATSSGEFDESTIDDLEQAPIDRLVRATRLLDHELAEQRREVRVLAPQAGRDEEVPLRDADQHP